MPKRLVPAIVAVFLAWGVMDFVIHGLLLKSTYVRTAELWRPVPEPPV